MFLDSLFNKLRSDGIGRKTRQAEVSSAEWRSGVIYTTTPRELLNAALYAVGKVFCLRGGQEYLF